ncbi:MAG: hypothetical protein WBP67_03410 [Thermoanaerobaculia bacterium]
MRKMMVWTITLALVWFGVAVLAVNGEEAEAPQDEADVIIKAGPRIIDDPRKEENPVPEVPFNASFVVEVRWDEPTPGLSLTLSNFRLVSFDETAFADRRVSWTWDDDNFPLVPTDEGGKEFENQVVTFLYTGSPATSKTLILRRESFRDVEESRIQLILFKQTVRDDSGVRFVHDPPWAGKPPTG